MLYHVIRRSPTYNTNNNNHRTSPTKSTSNYKNGSIPKLMSRYHYSKLTAPHSATTSSESFFPRQQLNGQSAKPTMTTTSNNNNSNPYSYSPFKSTFIPLVTNVRTMTPNKREFIQIPITREDGTPLSNNPMRSVPITFISETTPLPTTMNSNNGNTYSKPYYTSLLRPGSKYTRHHSTSNGNEPSATNIPRLPSVSRRLSLTVPVLTATVPPPTPTTAANASAKSDDESPKANVLSSPSVRQIPIQLTQPLNVASIPTNSSRISSAVLRSSSLSSNPSNNQLKRQKTDLGDISSSDFTSSVLSTSPVRRAEVMAREAIQGIARYQQQQQNDSISDNPTGNTMTSIRSPGLSRRVIVNLKNNQSVSLDSRLSSANAVFPRPPPTPSSSRAAQRNNPVHVPILQEIQMPSHPATMAAESTSSLPASPPFLSNRTHANPNQNSSSFKNEFRMEIPVQVITNHEQENSIEEKEDGIGDYEPLITVVSERIPSANGHSNPALKSILKRSSSRDAVPRKNVSFMNA